MENLNGIILNGEVFIPKSTWESGCDLCELGTNGHPLCDSAPCTTFRADKPTMEVYLKFSQQLTDRLNGNKADS